MVSSITGFGYLATLIPVWFLTYRFFQYWKKEKTLVAKLLFYSMAIFSVFLIICTVPTLFFANNTFLLKTFGVIISAFFQVLGCAVLGYLIFYLKFSKISPWIGFFAICFMGAAGIILSIITPFEVFLEPDGSINWGYRGIADSLIGLMYILTFLPLVIILFKQFKTTNNFYVKNRAIGLSAMFFIIMFVVFFDYGLEKMFNLRAVTSDYVQIILGIFLFIFLVITQKSVPKDDDLPKGYKKKIY